MPSRAVTFRWPGHFGYVGSCHRGFKTSRHVFFFGPLGMVLELGPGALATCGGPREIALVEVDTFYCCLGLH